MYDTVAIKLDDFDLQDWDEGCWEYILRPQEKMVYLRKYISGELNTDKGWIKIT